MKPSSFGAAPESESELATLKPVIPDVFSPGSEAPDSGTPQFLYYWQYIAAAGWRIITFVVLVTCAVVVYTLALPKEYDSSAIVRMDADNVQVVGSNQNENGNGANVEALLSTEEEVIDSPSVILKLIDQTNLAHRTEFVPTQPPPVNLDMDKLLKKVRSRITVTRPPGTLLLEIHFRSRDPQFAATAANTLAQVFLEQEFQSRATALTDASQYLSSQLDDIKAAMESSQERLVQYENQNNVVNPDDKTNVMQARMSQLNEDLTKADTEQMGLAASYKVAATGGLDNVLGLPEGAGMAPLIDQLNKDRRHLRELSLIYGPNHPVYKQANDTVQADERELHAQQQHVIDQIHSKYRAALLREQLLRSAMSTEKQQIDDFNLRAIKYSSLKAEAESDAKLYYSLLQHIKEANLESGFRGDTLRIISQARPSDTPVYPRIVLSGLLAFLLSAVLGVAAAIASGLWDRTFSSPDEIERRFHLAVLGSIPATSDQNPLIPLNGSNSSIPAPLDGSLVPATTAGGASSPFTEAILLLRSTVLFALAGNIPSVIAITSSVPGEGKSTISAHLAAEIASLGDQVLLIDGDLRAPNMHRLFRIANRQGLSSVLAGRTTADQVMIKAPGLPNLTLLPAGASVARPGHLLQAALPELMDDLRNQFNYILIDCPPALGFSDANAVATLADGVILVVHAGQTDRNLLATSIRQLRLIRVKLLGVILNKIDIKGASYYGYYKDYYKRREQDSEPDDSDLD